LSTIGPCFKNKVLCTALLKSLSFLALGLQGAYASSNQCTNLTFGSPNCKPLAFAAPSKLPSIELMQGFPDVEKINVAEYCAGKNVIIVGLPGAFTPT